MSTALTVRSATVPSPLDCVVSNVDWQSLVALLEVTLEDSDAFSTGNTEPAPSRRGLPWYRYNTDGTPDHWYVYSMGAWLRPHETAVGTVIMWEGVSADIPTFDGGEAGAVTSISGPMWEEVTEMRARFPIGPGTLPSTAVVGVGDTGGEEKHSLDETEIPPHSHKMINGDEPAHNDANTTLSSSNHVTFAFSTGVSGLAYMLQGTDTNPSLGLTEEVGGDGGTPNLVVAHNNLPPYRGIFFLRKTARLFYRI